MLPELLTEVPGSRSRDLSGELRRYESRNVTFVDRDWPVFWQRAEGVNVWDVDGNRYLDLTSAFGVTGLGHCEASVVAAIREQAGELLHAMGDVHPSEVKVALCRRLSELTFARWGAGDGKVILANSGFEAVEAALKTSLLYSGRSGVIAFRGAYHGLGYGALETSGIDRFKDPFRAHLRDFAAILPYPHCFRCPYGVREDFRLEGRDFPNCSSACLSRLREEIETAIRVREAGAILVEPVQGRGGQVVPPRDFISLLREICDAHKILLIADEIYTGWNRTGRLFACDWFDVVPDIVCVGKALASGFPISACVGRREIMDAWPESDGEALHTSTFLGNPVGCRAALASLELHADPGVAKDVAAKGRRLRLALRSVKSPRVGHVRGLGLLAGMELVRGDGSPDGALAIAVVKRALSDGLLLLADGPASNVLAFSPPFAISEAEIAFVADRLQEYLTSLPGSIS